MARDLSPPRSPVRRVEVDRSSPVPLYFQVATRLQELIEKGEIGVGTRIENEVDLAEPPALRHNALPTSLLQLTRDELAERGLYELLRRAGLTPRIANQTIGARV